MKLIVGLGNPGPRYAKNRHNVGFRCVDRLAQRNGLAAGKIMFKAYVVTGQVCDSKAVLARPLTFMNLSGQAVAPLVHWYRVLLPDFLVIYDDLDLPLGRIRLRPHGGAGGHKGMHSIIEALGTQDFARLRVGIGRPTRGDPQDYVLNDFLPDQAIAMEGAYDRAVAAVQVFIASGLETAMNQFNSEESTAGEDEQ